MDSARTADLPAEVQLPFFRSLFEDSPDPAIVVDPATGAVLAVTDGACRLYGLSRTDLLRQRPTDLTPDPAGPGSRSRPLTVGDRTLRVLLPGSIGWGRERTEPGQDPCHLATHYAPVGVALVGLDGTYVHVNPAMCTLLGYEPDELKSLSLDDVTHTDDRAASRELARALLAGEISSGQLEERAIRKDGRELWLRLTAAVARDGDGAPAHFVMIAEDISTARRLHDEQRALLRRVAEAGAAARLSEERYRVMFERASVGIAFVSPEGAIVDSNAEFERFTGYTAAELEGRTLDSLLAGSAAEGVVAGRIDGPDEAAPVQLFARKDGDLRWGSVRVSPIDGDSATLPFAMAMVVDVHEQKLLEEAVRIRERHFRSLIEKSVDVISILDADGTVLYESPAITAMTGYDPAELIGWNGFDLIHEGDRPGMERAWERLLAGATDLGTARFRLLHRDGSSREVEVTGTNLLDDPAVAGVVVNMRDIHDRVEAERQIRFQAQLLENVNQSILATDLDGRILYWNKYAEELYGWPRAEVLGRDVIEVTAAEQSHEQARAIMEDLRAGRAWSGEFAVRRRDGTEFFAAVTTAPVLNDQGEVLGVVGSSTDLTARRQLESQLVQSQKMEAVGRLAGGIAHDFNNLLTAIRGYAEFLRDDLPDGPQRADVEEILRVTERAVALTRQLLVFGKRQVTQPEVLDVNEAIDELRTMLGRLLGEHMDLSFELGADLPCAHVDRAQFEQVVMNLVLNARDAMPEGGRIAIQTVGVKEGPGQETGQGRRPQSGPGYVQLVVSDTGCGIAADALPHIFEPFFSTKGSGGTGLGLPTVYAIADQAGGDVRVESRVGEGTVFRVRLPAVYGAPTGPSAGPESPRVDHGAGTILLVEDEAPVRAVVRRTLEQRGYVVLEASDGDEAVRVAQDHPGAIHLLLTDVVLPRMSGPALAELIRADRPATPVLFMSGYADDAAAIQQVGGPDAPLLAKPFTPESVISRVAEAISTGAGS